jgi:hypothetical protein
LRVRAASAEMHPRRIFGPSLRHRGRPVTLRRPGGEGLGRFFGHDERKRSISVRLHHHVEDALNRAICFVSTVG